jgi:hypothetical protein
MILLRHFKNIFSRLIVVLAQEPFFFFYQSTVVLPLAFVSNSDVRNATKRLRPTKSAGRDGISSFVIKGCSEICYTCSQVYFNLSLYQNTFPILWKHAAFVSPFKEGKIFSLFEIIDP